MQEKRIVQIDLTNTKHGEALINLMDDYMADEMGIGEAMPEELAPKIIKGLAKHAAYIGFFVCVGDEYVALANCNLNYSTWEAKPAISIHDFIVSPQHRRQGIGMFLLKQIEAYAKEKGYCRINLEVRQDNHIARKLYKKAGFRECEPPNYFWEKKFE